MRVRWKNYDLVPYPWYERLCDRLKSKLKIFWRKCADSLMLESARKASILREGEMLFWDFAKWKDAWVDTRRDFWGREHILRISPDIGMARDWAKKKRDDMRVVLKEGPQKEEKE